MSKIANDDLRRRYLSSWHEGANHWKRPLWYRLIPITGRLVPPTPWILRFRPFKPIMFTKLSIVPPPTNNSSNANIFYKLTAVKLRIYILGFTPFKSILLTRSCFVQDPLTTTALIPIYFSPVKLQASCKKILGELRRLVRIKIRFELSN